MPEYRPHDLDPSVLGPYDYVTRMPGKDVRGKLVDAFQMWLKIPPSIVSKIKVIVGMLHNASLLVDDIEDNSKLRRGIPVAHSVYGVPSTINAANYVYFQALEQVHMLKNADAMNCFVGEMLSLHRGQGQEICWRDCVSCPTEEQYRNMVEDKTGGLFRLAVGLMQSFSGDSRDYSRLLNRLALYFQVRDDLINVSSTEYMKSKSFCEDLTEGKFSFPVIHCLHANPQDHRLLHIIRQRTEDARVKMQAVLWMKECGSLDYTRQVMRTVHKEIIEEIDALGGHPQLSELVQQLDQQVDLQEGSCLDSLDS